MTQEVREEWKVSCWGLSDVVDILVDTSTYWLRSTSTLPIVEVIQRDSNAFGNRIQVPSP